MNYMKRRMMCSHKRSTKKWNGTRIYVVFTQKGVEKEVKSKQRKSRS